MIGRRTIRNSSVIMVNCSQLVDSFDVFSKVVATYHTFDLIIDEYRTTTVLMELDTYFFKQIQLTH